MKVFHALAEAKELERSALALGNFDGVHLGHQALFAQAVRLGVPAALTFHPHPGKVLQPQLAPKLITPLPRKLELMAACGLAGTILQSFTMEYARTSPAAFEAALFEALKVRFVVVGSDFTYGAKRGGTVETLARSARLHGAELYVVPPVTAEGVVVSSTKVREYILEGRVEAARTLLGRSFDLDGVVVAGMGRGKGIGFPTANVDTQNELRPAPGVYAVRAQLRDEGSGVWLAGAANIGVKPTFGGTEVTIEVHLLDFEADLYGKRLRVQFLERIRSERRFGSVEELTGQIGRDVEAARTAIARADG